MAKPSILVLPFDNLSDDTEQSYFSDGITEDIITELSRFPRSFRYRAKFLFHLQRPAGPQSKTYIRRWGLDT